MWTIMASASGVGGASARASAQLDVTFAFGGRLRRFRWGPFLPNSLLFMICLIALRMDKTGQRGLLILRALGSTRMPTLFIVYPSPSSTATSQSSGLWLSCFMWLFPFNFKLSGLALHFYPVLLQEIAMCNLVPQLFKKIPLRTFLDTSATM